MSYFYEQESAAFKACVESLKKENKKVAVIGHVRPDGDCIGSTVAMVRILRNQGIDAVGLNNDEAPDNLKFLIGDTPFYLASEFTNDYRICITVDSADYKRVGPSLNTMFPNVFLNVDHHISNKQYAEKDIIIGSASATAEVIMGIVLDLGWEIDATTAQALYVGIATDTGQFRFPSTTKDTFEMVKALCDFGAKPAEAANELYENESFARIQLIQLFLASLKIECNGRVCFGFLTDAMYQESGASIDDADGLVDYARSIQGVEVGVLLEERNGALKGSLRAKDPKFRVDQIAQAFGGGGHACAAGLNVESVDIEAFKPQVLAKIEEQFTLLENE